MARMAFAQSAMRPQRSLPARENALKSDGYNVAVIHDPIRVFVGGIYVDGLRNDASHAEVAGMTSTASTSLGRTATVHRRTLTASTSLGRTSTASTSLGRTSTASTSLGRTSTASTSLGRTSTVPRRTLTASTSLGRTSTVPKRTSTTSTSLEWMSQLLGWTSAVSLLDANRAWTTANRVDAP